MPELSADAKAHRDWLLSFVPVRDAASIVDLGCGAGHDLLALALMHPGIAARFTGLDVSEKDIASALDHARDDSRVTFACQDLNQPLPFESATVDVVFTNNTLECLADPLRFANEIGRVLRPGGTLVAAHWDWDSQMFDGTDKSRNRRLVHAFADWQQAWMEHSDGWMGRRLWGIFASTGHFDGNVHVRTLTNTEFEAPLFGHARAQDFQALVKHALVSGQDVERFLQEQAELYARGRYLYSITGFAYVAIRRTPPTVQADAGA
jgi:SAM-dependent methyltransferase